MSSIFDLNAGSSDSEDDVDYVPPNGAESDESEECSEEELGELSEEPSTKKIKLNDIPPALLKKSGADLGNVWQNFLKGIESSPYGKKVQNGASSSTGTPDSGITSKSASSTGTPDFPCSSKSSSSTGTPDSETPSKSECTGDEKDVGIDHSKIEKEISEDNGVVFPEEMFPNESNDESTPSSDQKCDDKTTPSSDQKCDDKTTPSSDQKCDDIESDVKKNVPVAVPPARPRAGLSSILGTIANKGKKESVLEKSLKDWRSFKEDEGIDKDLETYNKGRSGFIERQRFLQRSDLRTFENEKSIRLSGKKKQ